MAGTCPTSLSLPTMLSSTDLVSTECDLTGYQGGVLLILGWWCVPCPAPTPRSPLFSLRPSSPASLTADLRTAHRLSSWGVEGGVEHDEVGTGWDPRSATPARGLLVNGGKPGTNNTQPKGNRAIHMSELVYKAHRGAGHVALFPWLSGVPRVPALRSRACARPDGSALCCSSIRIPRSDGPHVPPAVTSLSLAEHRASCVCFPEQSRETQSCPSPLDMYSAPQQDTAMHTARPPGGTATHLPGKHPTRGQRRARTQKSILHVAGLWRTTCDSRRRPTFNLSLSLRDSPP